MPCTDNAKILAISAVLFAVITTAQVFAARAANSSALMADCVSMGIDALSYCFNIVAEVCPVKNPTAQAINQLLGALISLLLLVYFTVQFFMEGLATVRDPFAFDSSCCDAQSVLDAFTGTVIPDPAEPCLAGEASTCALAVESFDPNAQLWENAPLCADGADSPTLEDGSPACVWTGVDPRIVCAFALFGLLFDIGSLFAFRSFGQGDVGELVGTKKAEDESEAVNMGSAFLHLMSDFLRSSSTLILSILIFKNPQYPSYIFDGYITVFITGTILLGAITGLFRWVMQMVAICTTGVEEGDQVIPAGPWGSTRPSITAQERRITKDGRLSNGKRVSKGQIMV